MNRILINPSHVDHNMGVLTSEILVDDMRLAPGALVDLRYLAKSAQTSGDHDIFTCSCGAAMCAGISSAIFVHHLHDVVEWHFNAVDCFGGGDGLSDEEYARLNTPGIYRFDPDEYQRAIENALEAARIAIARSQNIRSPSVEYPPQDIAMLTTKMFSDRDHVKARRCLGRTVVFRASDGMGITVDGIPFGIEQLALPRELEESYRAFEAAQCFPNDAEELACYESFLKQGRQFGQALRRQLGRESSVRFWYRYGPAAKPEVWSVEEELR